MGEAVVAKEGELVFEMPESTLYSILELEDYVAHLFRTLDLSCLEKAHSRHLPSLNIVWLLL